MTPEAVLALIGAAEVQPGWSVFGVAGPWDGQLPGHGPPRPGGTRSSAEADGVTVVVWTDVADVNDREKLVGISFSQAWTAREIRKLTERLAIDKLWTILEEAVLHEAKEWYRIRGAPIFALHKGT